MTARNAVDVWQLDLAGIAVHGGYQPGSLSNDERARAERFRCTLDRTRWVAYRVALRRILAAYLHVGPAEIVYAAGRNGKPHVARPLSPIAFNGSHSGDVALVAVASGFEVGIDVEVIRAPDDAEAVGRRFFSRAKLRRSVRSPGRRSCAPSTLAGRARRPQSRRSDSVCKRGSTRSKWASIR